MARPKKLSDADMIKIVNSFYESNGDPSMLKCSFLEEYAISIGADVKAYDFRRSKAVRARMDELKNLSPLSSDTGAISYKNLDVDAFLNRNNTTTMLRNSLLELDGTWRRIYEKAVVLSQKNESLLTEIFSKNNEIKKLVLEKEAAETEIKELGISSNKLLLENRYLKKMLKQYLYPAIANEILLKENVLEQVDTEVTPAAMNKMTEATVPSSFSSSVAADREILSREELLLERMKKQISGVDDNE